MIGHQIALIKREIWEHRSIWITPAAVAFVLTFLVIAMGPARSLARASWLAPPVCDQAIENPSRVIGSVRMRTFVAA